MNPSLPSDPFILRAGPLGVDRLGDCYSDTRGGRWIGHIAGPPPGWMDAAEARAWEWLLDEWERRRRARAGAPYALSASFSGVATGPDDPADLDRILAI